MLKVEVPTLQFKDHPGNVGQFLRPLDAGVRGEDLLEKRRSGAGQSHDEDRIWPWIAGSRAALEELAGANFNLFARVGLEDLREVAALRPLGGVSPLVVAIRFLIIARVFEGLAQSETHMVTV